MENLKINLQVKRLSDSLTPQLKSIQRALGESGRRKILTEVGMAFREMALSTFGSNKNKYRGNRWPRYSAAYAKRVHSSVPTLFRTGKLKSSIKMAVPGGNVVLVYANAKYAAAQALGTNRIPSRMYFPMEGRGSSWRLTAQAEKDLVVLIGKQFSMQSNGALPRILSIPQRSFPTYGNPLSAF